MGPKGQKNKPMRRWIGQSRRREQVVFTSYSHTESLTPPFRLPIIIFSFGFREPKIPKRTISRNLAPLSGTILSLLFSDYACTSLSLYIYISTYDCSFDYFGFWELGFQKWRRSGSWKNWRICRRILLLLAVQVFIFYLSSISLIFASFFFFFFLLINRARLIFVLCKV